MSKSDYKLEIYKIINDISLYLKQEHLDFFFVQIQEVPPEKMSNEEFTCLSELGKYSHDGDFKEKATTFFWTIICNAEKYKDELVANAITRFCEMVRSWDATKKVEFIKQLIDNLLQIKASIPSLKLMKGLIKDIKEKTYYHY